MFKLVIIVFLVNVVSFSSSSSLEDSKPIHSSGLSFTSAWETFWAISCGFSDLVGGVGVGRSKRSIPNEPDLNNPEELFKYLYPLADVTVEEYLANEQRSAHSFSTWMDDLISLWQSECRSRSQKKGRSKRDTEGSEDGDESLYDTEEEDNPYPYENTKDSQNATSSTTTPPPAACEKKDKKVIADADTFFTQYGGDIEYFFPLISFGIPFDGEITFLGFHGFKGLFPYK